MKPIKNSDRIESLMLKVPSETIAQAIVLTTMRDEGRQLLRGNIERSQLRKYLRDLEKAKEARNNEN